jgi:acetyltransferase-like isoleucine patch superfamily enzyme
MFFFEKKNQKTFASWVRGVLARWFQRAPAPIVLTEEMLVGRIWRFHHRAGHIASENFQLLPGGRIGGHKHRGQVSWHLLNGTLTLFNVEGKPTCHFTSVERGEEGLLLSGPHLPNPKIILCLSERDMTLRPIEGAKAKLAPLIAKLGWEIGEHTYGVPGFIEKGASKLRIGSYCSIANGVVICFADHRMDTVSTYPFRAMRRHWPLVPHDARDHVSRGDVIIGSDVWLGSEAFIGSGVTIGHGAVVAARAVVTRDVPPYAVVAGIPARVVRYRFAPHIIEALLEIAWWDWPDDVVNEHLPLMMSGDIEAFIAVARGVHGRQEEGLLF